MTICTGSTDTVTGFRIEVDDRRDLADPMVFDDAVQLPFAISPKPLAS